MVTQDCLGVSGAETGVGAGETGETFNSMSCDCSVSCLQCSRGAFFWLTHVAWPALPMLCLSDTKSK